MINERTKWLLITQLMLLFYSMGGICSKMASNEKLFSIRFLIYYGILLLILFIYAIGWQQILKRLPLTTAFSNKAVTVVWGIVWGFIFFGEQVSLLKAIGAVLIIVGVVLFTYADGEAAGDGEARDG